MLRRSTSRFSLRYVCWYGDLHIQVFEPAKGMCIVLANRVDDAEVSKYLEAVKNA